MSVSIRLAKIGKKYAPTYKVVAVPTRSKRTGEYLEVLGTFNPNVKPFAVNIEKEKVATWEKNGAIVSKAVKDILSDKYEFKPYNPKAAKKAAEKAKKAGQSSPRVILLKEMLEINIITLFPNLFEEFKNVLPFNRAIKNNLIKLNIINLKDFALDERGTVDDKPYGGGTGMILRPEPLFEALNSIQNKEEVVALTPKGETFNQKMAFDLSQKKSITFICGRYEGIDQRIIDNMTTKEISIGNFVCAGGEAPAITILESIVRLLPGILEEEVTQKESFSNETLEHPQYTRPENFNNWKVPEVLISGNHKEIEKWKLENSKKLN